ncbi:MAG: peptidase E [Anaerolineales bacterium]
MIRQIIAMGGGGFSMELDNLALDQFILTKTGKRQPSVCFIPTASGDAPDYIVHFYTAFSKLVCKPSHLSLFKLPTSDMEGFILEQDVIYVGGGNTRSMLSLWREWRMDEILQKAYQNGIILSGLSAGAICWFEQGVTDAVPGELGVLSCLGFLSGSCCPHFGEEPARRPAYHQLVSQEKILPGYGIDDGAALYFIDEQLNAVVSSRPDARAYTVRKVSGKIEERQLESTYLENL